VRVTVPKAGAARAWQPVQTRGGSTRRPPGASPEPRTPSRSTLRCAALRPRRPPHGWSDVGTGTTTLTRDGTTLGRARRPARASFVTPRADGRYRVEIDTTHPTFALTTHSTVAWTFTAPTGSGTTATVLPLSTARLMPVLDDTDTAPGGAYQIPMTVQPQPGSTAPTTRAVTLDVSYDDGVTWQPAR